MRCSWPGSGRSLGCARSLGVWRTLQFPGERVPARAQDHPLQRRYRRPRRARSALDGLLPFVLNRLKLAQPHIEAAGHKIRFAVARGPLNIASFLRARPSSSPS
jgi:hypothetical protein